MSVLRGSSAVRSAKKKQEGRASSGRGGGAIQLRLDRGLKPGESAETVGYFCGLFEEEVDVDSYLDDAGNPDLGGMIEEELLDMATEIGARVWEDIKPDHLTSSITRRLTGELEPVMWYRHYVDRNRGKKDSRGNWIGTYLNCGDPEAVMNALSYKYETQCRSCTERQAGDDGVGNPQQRICFSFFDLRFQHRTKGEDGGYDEYTDCTMEAKGRCMLCSKNRKIDPQDQSDMEKDRVKELFEGYSYSPVRQVGMRVFDLPVSQEPLVMSLATEIRTTMCQCEGIMKVIGGSCGAEDCGEPFDFDELVESGWNPEEPDPDKQFKVRCGECAHKGAPTPEFKCDGCDEPEPARFGDVPIKIKCIKGEKGSAWSFEKAGDVCRLELGDDEQTDRVLGCRMPNWEEFTKVPTPEQQLTFLGLRKDPLGSDDGVKEAPTFGSGKSSKSKGKGRKGGKGGKVKKSGFLGKA